jgi:hypothetical protein
VSWEPELEELRRREELARQMGGEERVARQHESGRLPVRERIERLFDAGTFHETGALAGRGTYDEDGELTGFLPARDGGALQRRGDHRPSRHAADPLRLGRAGARAGEARAASGTKDTRAAPVI